MPDKPEYGTDHGTGSSTGNDIGTDTGKGNGWPADRIDTGTAHSARIYDYLLGGKDHYPADIEAGEVVRREWPSLPLSMRANRDFMRRTVRHLSQEAGVRQFLDIGTGIPTSPNLHEVAQEVDPRARVLYVDNDPIVLTLSQGLLTSTSEGRTAYAEADMRRPEEILAAPELRETLDLDQPVAMTIIAILQFVQDEDDAYGIVRRLMEPLPSGSYLVISTVTGEFAPEVRSVAREYAARGMPMRMRTRGEVEAFFDGLDLTDPGIVQVHKWRPDGSDATGLRDSDVAMYGGVARKP